MVRKRRNNMQIIADILRIAKNGAKKTHIVYKANLNFKILHEYLMDLEDAGLINERKSGEIKTTDKGIQYLKHFKGFNDFMDIMAL